MAQAGSVIELLRRFWNKAGIDEARARLVASAPHRSYLDQALLLMELGRRAADPVEALPRGSRAAALLGLYRDAIHAALYYARLARAGEGGTARDGGVPPSLDELWGEPAPALLAAAAGSETKLAAARAALVERGPLDAISAATDEEAENARGIADGLVRALSDDERRLDRLVTRRWLRVAGAAAVMVVLTFGVGSLIGATDLAAGRKPTASSMDPICPSHPACANLLFHTNVEANPWVEIDLGDIKKVSRVELVNRRDCCQDRAVPLVIELGTPQRAFTQVANRDEVFKDWTAKFPARSARFVRVVAKRSTALHLAAIRVY